MARAQPRVVSLIASATEIVHALGHGEWQVARSHECDWPPAVLDLPALTRPKFRVAGATSRDIDLAVRTLVEQGLAVYEVDAARLKACGPDVILTQDHCEVCAVALADVERAVNTWVGRAAKIVSLRPHRLADVFADMRLVAATLGRERDGEDLIKRMEHRIEKVRTAVASRPRTTIAFIEWIDPPMSGGHWMPELIAAAGAESLFGAAGVRSPWITWDDVAAADPDVILIAPCGYHVSTTLAELQRAVTGETIWATLRAVAQGRVFIADGNAYFNRPGPRLAESAEILAEIAHPGRCDFGHEGHGYVRFTG